MHALGSSTVVAVLLDPFVDLHAAGEHMHGSTQLSSGCGYT